MKYGIREICDVVLKAKSRMKVGNKIFYKNEPVLYFDSLKTSTLEGSTTTLYAQGGRGNSRLMAWEGERTVTFTMEDALISDVGLSILTGAELIETKEVPIIQHLTEILTLKNENFNGDEITLSHIASSKSQIYVMKLDVYGEVDSEPYIYVSDGITKNIRLKANNYQTDEYKPKLGDTVLIDYYTELSNKAQQINITANSFGGNFYLEASTLFRAPSGVDMPAEFIIPNCKVQSNFTFNMASSGDPSTFTFTMDAFPDYTRFDKGKKVLLAIQVMETQTEDKLEYYSEGLEYTLKDDDGTYTVTGIGKCTDTDIIIPSKYKGMAVTSIGKEAFDHYSGLTSITIPDSVTIIGESAFLYCDHLTSVTIGNNVTSIELHAFDSCTSLTSVTIPDSVTIIGECAFYYCPSLTSVTIGNNVTSIDWNAFYGCSSLTSVTIPNSVTTIRSGVFAECYNLTRIDIEKNLVSGAEPIDGCPWGAENATIYWNGVPDTQHGAGGNEQ